MTERTTLLCRRNAVLLWQSIPFQQVSCPTSLNCPACFMANEAPIFHLILRMAFTNLSVCDMVVLFVTQHSYLATCVPKSHGRTAVQEHPEIA